MQYTPEQVGAILGEYPGMDRGIDNQGQVILYTRLYKWEDGTFHDEPENEVGE